MAVRKNLLAVVSLAMLAGGSIAVPVPVFGQESLAIEEIVVTARKRAEVAQDVPIPITALTTELAKSTVRDLSDLNGYAPNVSIQRDPGRSNGISINIRGISPTRTDDNSFDAPIAVMIDGIHLGSLGGQLLENFDLERVEVLRGPQGTLFGKNTVGGVINVVRSRPTGEVGGKFKLTGGVDGQREARGVLNFPLIADRLAGKLFFTDIHHDGYLDNTFLGGDMPKKDYQNYGITLLATPTESFDAVFTWEQYRDDSQIGGTLTNYNLAPGVAPVPADPREQNLSGGFLSCLFGSTPCRTDLSIPDFTTVDLENPASHETDALTLNMTWDLNDEWRLVSVTGYRDTVEDRKIDFDGSSSNFITIERDNDYEQLSQELRVEGSFDNFNIVAGVYLWESEFEQFWSTGGSFWTFVGGLNQCEPNVPCPYSLADNIFFSPVATTFYGGVSPVQACLNNRFGNTRCDPGFGDNAYGANFVQRLFEAQETSSQAVFIQADWQFAEDWTLTAGLRWTEEEKDFLAGQAYLSPLSRERINAFPAYADLDNKWTEVSPRLGLSWQVSDDVLAYVSYAEGFHSGGFFGVNQNVADFVRDQYNPEFSNNYEVGIKSQLFDNRVQLNASYFFNDFEDKQEQSVQVDPSTNTVATVFSNAASATYQGFEVEAQWVATANLNLFATFGLLDAEYDDFRTDVNPNDGQSIIVDASFLDPRNAPEVTYGVGGVFTIQVGEGELEAFVKYAFIDELETNLLNLEVGRAEERGDLQASISYTFRSMRFTAFGTNLTDEEFEIPAIIFPLFASGTTFPPRAYGVEFEYAFGNN